MAISRGTLERADETAIFRRPAAPVASRIPRLYPPVIRPLHQQRRRREVRFTHFGVADKQIAKSRVCSYVHTVNIRAPHLTPCQPGGAVAGYRAIARRAQHGVTGRFGIYREAKTAAP